MEINVSGDSYWCKILINGVVHLKINRRNYNGFHAYIDYNAKVKWQIEIYQWYSAPAVVEYDTEEKWLMVINLLDENL